MFFRLRIGRLLGGCLFVLGLLDSYSRQAALGRRHYAFLAVLLGAVGWCIAALIGTWRSARARASPPGFPPLDLAVAVLDIGILSWGAAYFLSSVDDPASAGRIFDLNLFGSVTPSAVLVEWIALLALTLAGGILVFPRLPTRYANPAVACGAVIAVMLAGEGAARVKALVAPTTEGFPTSSSALWFRRYVRLNRDGFRDGPHASSPEPGTRRLLVIGDSYAFGTGIKRLEGRFGEQLGTKLAAATGERWEIINASQGGANTLDEIALLQRMLSYRPDIVVLVYVFNDIEYLRHINPRMAAFDASTILRRLYPVRVMFLNSYLFQELYVRVRFLSWLRASLAMNQDAYADSAMLAVHLKDVGRFVALAQQGGALVGIVPFDHSGTLAGALGSANRHRYDTFVSRARAVGLPVWPVNGAFERFDFSALIVNKLDVHPNELANRLAAENVAPQVVATLERERSAIRPRSKLTQAGGAGPGR